MIIERVSRVEASKISKTANFAMSQLEGKWETNELLINLDSLKKLFDSQRKSYLSTNPKENADELNWDLVVKQLRNGKVVADMFNLYRIKNDLPKCPMCGSSYEPGEEALSRRDNHTSICSDCGTREAFIDLKRSLNT